MRVFARSPEGSDLDFFLYSNVNRTAGSLKYISIGEEDVESALWKLEPQSDDYLLDVFIFNVFESKETCPHFHFELAMKTNTTIQEELKCPAQLPAEEVPPPSVNINGFVLQFRNDYVFTKERIEANTRSNTFTYRITLRVFSNTTFMASISYDFLANDFRLNLRDSNGQLLVAGTHDANENRDNYFNFMNTVTAYLVVGTYYLDIVEDLGTKNLPFEEYCHKFGFVLTSVGLAVDPTIDLVLPPGGTNLNPFVDLAIDISFSQPVLIPSDVSLETYIESNRAIYLTQLNDAANRIYPHEASFHSTEYMTMTLLFPSNRLAVGTSYKLNIDASKFKTDNNRTFKLANENQQYIYVMKACDCSGHGTCTNINNK
jgi:hypothetical protein